MLVVEVVQDMELLVVLKPQELEVLVEVVTATLQEKVHLDQKTLVEVVEEDLPIIQDHHLTAIQEQEVAVVLVLSSSHTQPDKYLKT